MLNFCDLIQVFVFTTNHHIKTPEAVYEIWPVFSEKSFEIVDGRADDRRANDGICLYYKLPRSLRFR